LSGVAAGWAARLSARLFHSSAHESWDCFTRHYVKRRWVILDLENGQRYAGMVQNADVSANASERDLVLCEPALYDSATGDYLATPYQYMYFPAKMLSVVGALSVSSDKRLSTMGHSIFPKESSHAAKPEPDQGTAAVSTAATVAGIGSTQQAGQVAEYPTATAPTAEKVNDHLRS
jgi:hypothetical protein